MIIKKHKFYPSENDSTAIDNNKTICLSIDYPDPMDIVSLKK